MKKIIKLFILLLIIIPFVNVNALVISANIEKIGDGSSNIHWFLDEKKGVGAKAWEDYNNKATYTENNITYRVYHMPGATYKGTYHSKPFKAVCIEPGAEKGPKNYLCRKITGYPEIEKMFEGFSGNQATDFNRILAIRLRWAQVGAVSNNQKTSMYWYAMTKDESMFGEASSGSAAKKGVTGTQFANAKKIIQSALSALSSPVQDPGETKIEAEFDSGSGDRYTIRVSTNKNMLEVPTFTCVGGCTSVDKVNWAPGATSGTVVVIGDPKANNCKISLKMKYSASDEGEGSLYYCTSTGSAPGQDASSTDQDFLGYIPNDVLAAGSQVIENEEKYKLNPTGTYSEKVLEVKDIPGCDDCDCVPSTQVEKHIELCCEGKENKSYVYEPKINEIFCVKKKDCGTNEDIEVNGAYDSASGIYQAKEVNDYCKIYCTEKVSVRIPGALNSKNGKYFKLKGTSAGGTEDGLLNSVTSQGPVVWGNFVCRNVIYYDKWINQYIHDSEEIVKQFNKFQETRALYDSYKDALDEAENGKSTTYVVTWSYPAAEICENGHCCTPSGQSDSCNAPFTYKKYVNKKNISFQKAKIKYGNNKKSAAGFTYLQFEPDTNGTTSHEKPGYYNITWDGDQSIANCPSGTTIDPSKPASCYEPCKANDANCPSTGYYVTGSLSKSDGFNENNKPTDINKEGAYDKALSDAQKNAEEDLKTLNGKIEALDQLHDKVEECDDFFKNDKSSNAEKDADFVKKKVPGPEVSFNWFFVYISVDNFIKSKEESIGYEKKCTYDPAIGEYPSGTDADKEAAARGAEGPQYDTKNNAPNDTYENVFKKFGESNDSCYNNSKNCKQSIKSSFSVNDILKKEENSQKYTSDTLYTYSCTYSNQQGPKYTVYPYGGYSESQSIFTGAKYENSLYMEYSALYGTYQTYWTFSGLGSTKNSGAGKFDDEFKSGTDCAGQGVSSGSVDYYCKLSVKTSLSRIKGCNVDIVSMNYGSKFWSNVCCKDNTCKSYIDDTLTFAFKIVDPTNIFPGSKDNDTMPQSGGKDYAYNWFRTQDEIDKKKTIQKESVNDKLYDPSRITYQFQLNAKALKKIKEYNAAKNEYNSLNGTYTGNSSGALTRFHSSFIENYYDRKIVMPDNSTVNLGTDKYKDKALENARSKVVWEG